jgi:hypothetical protein
MQRPNPVPELIRRVVKLIIIMSMENTQQFGEASAVLNEPLGPQYELDDKAEQVFVEQRAVEPRVSLSQ